MTKIKMTQTKDKVRYYNVRVVLSLEHLIFEFVSNFDIRISNFVDQSSLNHYLWA